jgi:ribosomal protein S6
MDGEKATKSYEISFLLKSEEDAALVVKELSDHGAEVISEGSLDHIRLAYTIKKENSAYFGYIHFKASPEEIEGITETLKLEPRVVRFLIITPPLERIVVRRTDFSRPAERAPEAAAVPKTEPLSNAELEEKLEEILK